MLIFNLPPQTTTTADYIINNGITPLDNDLNIFYSVLEVSNISTDKENHTFLGKRKIWSLLKWM